MSTTKTVTLIFPTGDYPDSVELTQVVRLDTDAAITLPADTTLESLGAGRYRLSFDEPSPGLRYRYTCAASYGGTSVTFTGYANNTSAPTLPVNANDGGTAYAATGGTQIDVRVLQHSAPVLTYDVGDAAGDAVDLGSAEIWFQVYDWYGNLSLSLGNVGEDAPVAVSDPGSTGVLSRVTVTIPAESLPLPLSARYVLRNATAGYDPALGAFTIAAAPEPGPVEG